MATTFHNFSMLPSELRLTIWEYSLDEEKAGRHVLLRLEGSQADAEKGCTMTVMPTRHLTSPLLRVDHEARGVFLKYFPLALDVSKTEVTEHNLWARFMLTEPTQAGGARSMSRRLYYDNASLQAKWRHVGLLHLNPETDIFVLGFGPVTGSERNLPQYRKILECQSSPLPRQATGSIKQVLCLSTYTPCEYIEHTSSWDVMSVDTFTSVRTYRYIGPRRLRGNSFDEKVEWERLRWSAARHTPREFKGDMAQTNLPLLLRWIVHNGRRCKDQTIRMD